MADPGTPGVDGTTRTVDSIFDLDTQFGRDLAAVDWAATPLGEPESWPPSLRNIVRLQLGSRFAMWMAWGPDLTFLCNDAYRRGTLGAKYPWALGRPASEVWSEIWPDIGPRIGSVIETGVATWDEDLLLFLERSGYQEETYHTFSYSPITGDDDVITGMLCVVSEETARVIGDRRMATLRDLGTALAAATSETDVCAAAGRVLATDPHDVPFAVGYLLDVDGSRQNSRWRPGSRRGTHSPPSNSTRAPSAPRGRAVLRDRRRPGATVGARPDGRVVRAPDARGRPPVRPARARRPFGFLVAGLDRYRELDDDYRGFLELVAGQIASAVTRARAFEQERRRAEALAELDRAKTTFFTNVSHELRTPLTLLLGPSSDALEDVAEPLTGSQRSRMDVVHRNAERLLKLVNTLLDFSRMQSGRVEARFEPLDLAQYTAELASMFDSAFRRAGLALDVDCVPLPERAHVDREMWAKIVLNLVSNALKATFTGGVTVGLRAVGRCGRPDGDRHRYRHPARGAARLFERFHRVSGAQLRSHEGSGIGLALVAELAAVHGGTVAVTSVPGQGSTFTVTVPIGTEHLPPDMIARRPPTSCRRCAQYGAGYLAEAARWLSDEPASTRSAASPATAPRVLVVDDNADMRKYVGRAAGRGLRRRRGRGRHRRPRGGPARTARPRAHRRDDAAPGRLRPAFRAPR